MALFEREMKVFNRCLPQWRKERLHQFVLIHDEEVVGFYPTWGQAMHEAYAHYEPGDFMCNEIQAEDEGIFITRLAVPVASLDR